MRVGSPSIFNIAATISIVFSDKGWRGDDAPAG
jgi:hypothetical protein